MRAALLCLAMGSVVLAWPGVGAADAPVVIRYRPDPPPAVDGQLGPWQGRPPTFVLDRPEQVTDGTENRPDKWMTSSPAPWSISRSRLLPAVLARADGGLPAPVRPVALFGAARLSRGERRTVKFPAAKVPGDREAVLSLKARTDFAEPGGYNPGMQVRVNGVDLDGQRLLGRPLHWIDPQGRINNATAGTVFNVHYAPDFTAADRSFYAIPGAKSGEFQFRVGDLLRDGENELVISDVAPAGVKWPLVIADGELRFTSAIAARRPQKRPAPAGRLPVFRPGPTKTEFRLRELPEAGLAIEVGGETFTVASQFSTPGGRFAHGSTPFFLHSRRIERRDEALVIEDHFRNLIGEDLPLVQRHRAKAGGKVQAVWVAGLSPNGLSAAASEPANPTVFAATAKAGLGLLPLGDEFQVHVSLSAVEGELVLGDPEFVLKRGASYTARWAIVPAALPDYFTFLNSARRLVDANFPIRLGFAFLRAGPLTEQWTDRQFADFIRFKSANAVCASIDYPSYKGWNTHGTSFQAVPHDNYRRWVRRVHRLAPQTKALVYFHCFLDVLEGAERKYADARVLRVDGLQADYGEPQYKIFFPLATNSYGPRIAKNPEVILDEIGADGVYWDELEYSACRYHYGEPWDGCSADIDPATMKIVRQKSSVTLLTQPWRVALARKILARGPLVGNGQPHTPTMAALRFPRFVETGSPSNCALAQLHSPIALGDHLTERSEQDAYRNMLGALDYGCLYHWYNDVLVIPTHTTLTEHMYPFTPVELHRGYVIGRERIITRQSGLFGWGDAARHEVHVYDDSGREVPGYPAPQITRQGATFTELRLAEDWSAVIVRR
jgi:hypothetical protein